MVGEEVAIFWDYENVRVMAQETNVPMAESLINFSESIGHPRVKIVYSNWKNTNDAIIQGLYSLGFETIQISMGKPNSVDVKLAVDCMSVAHENPTIKHFIIVTGDKDYIPLVNWLRKKQKDVIIIGKSDVVSDHLMASASEFVSLEELSRSYIGQSKVRNNHIKIDLVTFEEAVKCLKEAISRARDQGKSTQFSVIDTLMRSLEGYNYTGYACIKKNDTETFSSFTDFIATAEKAKKVKTQTLEGFKELFLIEEDPTLESGFSPELLDVLQKEHWRIIITQIEKSFKEEMTKPTYGRYMVILKYVRDAKKEGKLPFSNQKIQDGLSKLVEKNILVRQIDGSYRFIDNYQANLETILEDLVKE